MAAGLENLFLFAYSSRLPSNEQVVKAWFRDYSSGLSPSASSLADPRPSNPSWSMSHGRLSDIDRVAGRKRTFASMV